MNNFIRRHSQLVSLLFLIAIFNASTGCKNTYYKKKVRAFSPVPVTESIVMEPEKYVVVHMGEKAFHLTDIVYDTVKAVVTGSLTDPGIQEMFIYGFLSQNKTLEIKRNAREEYKKQVHVFVTNMGIIPGTDSTYDRCEIPVSSFYKMEYFGAANGKIFLERLEATVLITVVPVSIFLVSACNCPSVYTSNGNEIEYNGGIFPGALSSNAQRRDVLAINDYSDVNGNLSLKITNKPDEHQYIDQLGLLSVTHPAGTSVMFDHKLVPHVIAETQTPLTVTSDNGVDHRSQVLNKGDTSYSFSDPLQENNFNDLNITFDNKEAKQKANLVLNTGNTPWASYAYDNYASLYGKKFSAYDKRMESVSLENKVNRQIDQGIMMSVYMKKKGKWVFVDYLEVAGAVHRDIVVPLDLAGMQKGELVELKLRAGFRLWDVDFVGMDFSEKIPLTINAIAPASVTNASGSDILNSVLKTDGFYDEHILREDFTTVNFVVPQLKEGETRSLFLEGTGYYKKEYKSEDKPQTSAIWKFRKPGYFSYYSEMEYEKLDALAAIFKPGSPAITVK